jgi:hypothetical protein
MDVDAALLQQQLRDGEVLAVAGAARQPVQRRAAAAVARVDVCTCCQQRCHDVRAPERDCLVQEGVGQIGGRGIREALIGRLLLLKALALPLRRVQRWP